MRECFTGERRKARRSESPSGVKYDPIPSGSRNRTTGSTVPLTRNSALRISP